MESVKSVKNSFPVVHSRDTFLRKFLETIQLTVLRKICYFWPHIPLARMFHELLLRDR
jgi:hypothetical protein